MQFVDEKLNQYCIQHSTQPTKICDEIESYTKANFSNSQMLIGKLEASLLGVLISTINAKNILEIGTYTGYSAMAMAGFLPQDGKIITLDRNPETTELAKSFWKKSEHGKKITAHVGAALEIIPTLNLQFDLIFIDADKENYPNYFNQVVPMLSQNGIIVVDNCLWSGNVTNEQDQRPSTTGIRRINELGASSNLFVCSMLPVRDGMFILKKK